MDSKQNNNLMQYYKMQAMHWEAKYRKEHKRRKKINKYKKKATKQLKKRTKQVNQLQTKLMKLKPKIFLAMHDYF